MIKVPDKEILWVQFLKAGVVTHVITSDFFRSTYYLYRVNGDALKKTRYKSDNPLELNEIVYKEQKD